MTGLCYELDCLPWFNLEIFSIVYLARILVFMRIDPSLSRCSGARILVTLLSVLQQKKVLIFGSLYYYYQMLDRALLVWRESAMVVAEVLLWFCSVVELIRMRLKLLWCNSASLLHQICNIPRKLSPFA